MINYLLKLLGSIRNSSKNELAQILYLNWPRFILTGVIEFELALKRQKHFEDD